MATLDHRCVVTFIIDESGIIRWKVVHDSATPRDAGELPRHAAYARVTDSRLAVSHQGGATLKERPLSPRLLGSFRLGAYADEAISGFASLAEAVRSEGAALLVQLTDPGRHLVGDRLGNRSASAIPYVLGVDTPHRLSESEIRRISRLFGEGAARMARAGVDGLEIALGHGHLLHQYLSPVINQRNDSFGGSLSNPCKHEAPA